MIWFYFLKPITNLTRVDNYTQKNLQHTQINEYRHMLMFTLGIAATLDILDASEYLESYIALAFATELKSNFLFRTK